MIDPDFRQPESGVYCSRCGAQRHAMFNGDPAECSYRKCPAPKHDMQHEANHATLRGLVAEAIAPIGLLWPNGPTNYAWRARAALGE